MSTLNPLNQQLCADVPLEERESVIASMAYNVMEDETISRPLTEEELQAHKQALFEVDVEIEDREQEFKAVKDEFKNGIKAIKAVRSTHMKALRFKSSYEKGTIYLIDDQSAGMMGYYDGNGVLLSARPLKPEERQLSIMSEIAKNGTNK